MALTIEQKAPNLSRLVPTDQAGHWYTEQGESAHVIMGKSGKERNTTVADARKLNLLPSVTSVLSVMEKPQLTAWKIEQAIMSSLTLPKEEGETLEEYARRVVKDSKESTTAAAEHGTLMHIEMENVLLKRPTSKEPKLQPYIQTFKEWADANIEKTHWCERALVGAGFAGRCDAYVRLRGIGDSIVDLKNRKVNPKYDPFYDSDCAQLWAYRSASENQDASCVSIVLASNDPTQLKTKQWDNKELYEAGVGFMALLKVWAWSKQYVPPGMKV